MIDMNITNFLTIAIIALTANWLWEKFVAQKVS